MRCSFNQNLAARQDRCPETGIDDDGRCRLADDRGASKRIARSQLIATKHGRVRCDSVKDRWRAVVGLDRPRPNLSFRFACHRRPARHLNPRGHNLQRPRVVAVPVKPLMLIFVRRSKVAVVRPRDIDRRFDAGISKVERADGSVDSLVGNSFRPNFRKRSLFEFAERRLQIGEPLRRERLQHGLLGEAPHVGLTDAVRAENAGQRVDQDSLNAKLSRDRAGVLSARSAKSDKHVIRRVVAFRDGDFSNRPHHARVGDLSKSLGETHRRTGSTER